MFTSKDQQLNKQLKTEKQLKRLRKPALAARKKAVRQYQLHCLKGADASLLTRAPGNQESAKKQYVSALKVLDIEREFNHYIYTLNRLTKKSSTIRTKRSYKRAAKYCKWSYNLAVSRYRRRLRTT